MTKPAISVSQSQGLSLCAIIRVFVAFIKHFKFYIFVILQSCSVGADSYYISGVSQAKAK